MRKALKAQIEASGRYSEIRIFTAEMFLRYQEDLASAAKTALEAGYRWLSEYIWRALENVKHNAASALYSELRQSMPVNLVDNIWLYAVAGTKGVYIPDTRLSKVILDRVGKRKITSHQSPLSLAVDFSTRVLEFDKLFSKIAIVTNQTLEKEFKDALYLDSGFEIAEELVYQSQSLAVQPLVSEGGTKLVAGYPTVLRPEIEPLLKSKQKELKEIMDAASSELHLKLKQTDRMIYSDSDIMIKRAKWLELKPNVFGIGLNINQIIEDILHWRRKRSGK